MQQVLRGLATAPRRHRVSVLVRGAVEEIAARLPPGLATLTQVPPVQAVQEEADDRVAAADAPWSRAELQIDDLAWVPALLASLDRPFVIERPEELPGPDGRAGGPAGRLRAPGSGLRPRREGVGGLP